MSIFTDIKDRISGKRERQVAEQLLDALSQLPELRESYGSSADISLNIEDKGWIRLTQNSGIFGESDTQTRRRTIERARAYWLKDPLAHQAVRLWTDYSIGDGINFSCENTGSDTVLRSFWENTNNRKQFSAEGQRINSNRLLVDGEVFFALVGASPDVAVRTIDPLEISSIIADPDDADRILFYKREWIPSDIQQRPQGLKIRYYRDYTVDPAEAGELAGQLDAELDPDVCIYHAAFDRYGRWGNSLLTSALDWNREHRRFMEARVSIIQSLARFAFKAKVAGGSAAINAMKSQLNTNAANQQPLGATWLENTGIEMNAMPRDTGAASAKGDGDMLKLQVCAATGIMQHYLGDPSTGNLASTTAMELPMLKMFASYQRLWTDVYKDIFCYVAGAERSGDIGLDIDWPPIIDIDDNLRAQAISTMVTTFPALADVDAVKLQALETLRINDVENVLEEFKTAADTRKAEADAIQQQEIQNAAKMPINPSGMKKAMSPVESLAEALRDLREEL